MRHERRMPASAQDNERPANRELAETQLANTLSKKAMTLVELKELARQLRFNFNDQTKWYRIPVTVRQFFTDPTFCRDESLWPIVLDELEEMNSGKYTEGVLTGGIGVAKTTMAVSTLIYQTYILSCMRDPHGELGQNPRHEIVMIIQALNKEGAKEIGYTRMRNTIAESPYFQQYFMFNTGLESQMRFPRNVVVKPIAGHETAAIGQNVLGGILDEINFMKVIQQSAKSRDGEVFNQAKKNYNTIAMRRTTRFMKKGWTPGMLMLVSSRNYPGQFTDVKEEEARTNPRIYVYDKRKWELTPDDFNPERFNLFIGDDTHKPRVMKDGETLEPALAHLRLEVPTDLKPFFETGDIMEALRDIAGVAPSSIHPFILNKDKLTSAFGQVESILSRESCDFKNTKVQVYPAMQRDIDRPRWLHYDPALTGDHGGLAMGYVSHFVNVRRGPDIEILPFVVFDFVLDIVPPLNGEIEFESVHKLAYLIRDLGWPLQYVSMDTFQSRNSIQTLGHNDFKVGVRSMDTDTMAYDVTKLAFYDDRVALPEHERAMMELARIELNVKKKKIDHPPNGSKDCSDAIAGVILGLTMQRQIWRDHGISMVGMPRHVADIIAAIAKEKNSVDSRERRKEADDP